jgi:hypothetical protein
LPEPLHPQPETGQGHAPEDAAFDGQEPIATVQAHAIEVRLLPLGIDEPVLGNTPGLILPQLFHPVAGLALGTDDLDDHVGRSVEVVALQSGEMLMGHEQEVGPAPRESRAELHLKGAGRTTPIRFASAQ